MWNKLKPVCMIRISYRVILVFAVMFLISGEIHANKTSLRKDIEHRISSAIYDAYKLLELNVGHDSCIQQCNKELELLTDIIVAITNRMDLIKGSSLNKVLDELGASSNDTQINTTDLNIRGALDLIQQYKKQFVMDIKCTGLNANELDTIKKYRQAIIDATEEYIWSYGQEIAYLPLKENRRAFNELCLAVSYLKSEDRQWGVSHISKLPEWMKTPETIGHLEWFSLKVSRPYSGYQLYLYLDDKLGKSQEMSSYDKYLEDGANRLIRSGEILAAIHCYREALVQIQSYADVKRKLDYHKKIAQLYADNEHSQLAANEIESAIRNCHNSDDWGSLSILHLKYLYQANALDEVIGKSEQYGLEKACESFIPQINYVRWAAYRRQGYDDEAGKLQEEFLVRFPNHLLCADIYFAMAMQEITNGNYDEAQRIFEIIEYRYSESRLIPKIIKLQERIKNQKTSNK